MSTPAVELVRQTPERATHALQGFAQFARVVRYRQNVLFAALAVAVLFGGLYYATTKRVYQAKASLLVLQTGSDVTNTAMTAEGVRQGLMPTYERLFSSAVVLDGALRNLQPADRADLVEVPPEKWINTLRANLSASTLRQTNIIEIGFRSKSPSAAVAVVNAVLRSYLEFMEKTHKGTAGQIIEVITREKGQLEQRLATKEAEVLETRRRFGDLGIRSGGTVVHPTVQRAISLNEALIKTQQKRIELQASQSALETAVRNGEDLRPQLLSLENVVGREFLLAGFGMSTHDLESQAQFEKTLVDSQAELKTLQGFFGPAHPRVIAVQERIRSASNYLAQYQQRLDHKLSGVRDRQLGPMLSQMVAQRLNETWRHEGSLRAGFEQARHEAVELNGDMARLEILEHDLRWLRDLRDVLLNQIASVDLRQDHGDIRTAVVSEPVLPLSPVWPKLPIVGLCCLLAGGGAGLAAIYALDILDDHFRSPDELREQLGLELLAMVREMPGAPAQGLSSLRVVSEPNAVESEAFRTLRTTLALNKSETSRLVVSSAEPGDGKTTVAANLAVSFAQAGKRTLLIDADMRRPGLTTLLEAKGKPGLADVLVGTTNLHQAGVPQVFALGVGQLDFLPAGTRRPDSAELLASQRLAELLAWAESRYDQILIDSPPGLAASDASIIGRLVDGLVLVVQPQKTQRRSVVHVVKAFGTHGVTVLGLVVNRIASQKENSVYGYNFAAGYGYGYEDESKPQEAAMVEMKRDWGEPATASGSATALRRRAA
ncbi:MAG TPA: polysaccharide biosynthesis tyrosine autokinase [Pirellulales bacterium]|nr:polysaccharide biosynthesis tyrosine autokinase [Pirellulales bacterium]